MKLNRENATFVQKQAALKKEIEECQTLNKQLQKSCAEKEILLSKYEELTNEMHYLNRANLIIAEDGESQSSSSFPNPASTNVSQNLSTGDCDLETPLIKKELPDDHLDSPTICFNKISIKTELHDDHHDILGEEDAAVVRSSPIRPPPPIWSDFEQVPTSTTPSPSLQTCHIDMENEFPIKKNDGGWIVC